MFVYVCLVSFDDDLFFSDFSVALNMQVIGAFGQGGHIELNFSGFGFLLTHDKTLVVEQTDGVGYV